MPLSEREKALRSIAEAAYEKLDYGDQEAIDQMVKWLADSIPGVGVQSALQILAAIGMLWEKHEG